MQNQFIKMHNLIIKSCQLNSIDITPIEDNTAYFFSKEKSTTPNN